MFEFISQFTKDTNPDLPGLQPSILYVASCLIVPIATGLLIGLLAKLLSKRFGVEMPDSH